MKSQLVIISLLILSGNFLAPLPSSAQAALPHNLPRTQEPLTMQEKWVLARLAQGELADLNSLAAAQPHQEGVAVLRGAFLEALLNNDFPNFRVHWHGVQIRNAIIKGEVNLEGGEIPFGVKLYSCLFTDRVILQESRFKQSLWIFRSTFARDVDGLRIEIDKNCYLNGCIFQGNLNLAWGRIGKEFSLMGASFLNSKEAKFEGLEIGSNALANGAVFSGSVNFYRAAVGANLECNDAAFSKKVNFSEIRVNGNLGSHRALFASGASFSRATVGKGFLATDLTFTDKERFASFPEMRIGHIANLQGSHFAGPVDLNGVTVGDALIVDKVFFGNDLHANGLTVQNIVSFKETVCRGSVFLADVEIGGQINAYRARFEHASGFLAPGMRVGQLVKLSQAFFAGPLNFTGVKIGGEFRADAREVDKGTVFEEVIFLKEVSLQDAQLSDLLMRGIPERLLLITQFNLDRTVVNRDCRLQDVEIGELQARRFTGKGETIFQNVRITGKANFQESSLAALQINQTSWPTTPDGLDVSGLSFQSIRGASVPDVLAWLNQAVFDTRNYKNYQTYLERIGHSDWADEVFISMKRREGGVDTWQKRLNPLKWPLLFCWDWPVGYGRRPQSIFWFALPFILFGAVLLDPRYLNGIRWPQKNICCNLAGRLLLSIDKFTPKLLEFGLEDKWQPPHLTGFQQSFLYLHRLMGKVFMSIFFIAVYARFR